MQRTVKIGNRLVGDGQPCYVIAEIGINHNGDLEIARQLIHAATVTGCNAVKFQKRTVDLVYSTADLERKRESPFGNTNGDLERGLEFSDTEYAQLAGAASRCGLDLFASCWDELSVDFMERYSPPCYKIASASITDVNLIRYTCGMGKPILMSTGMCNFAELDRAVDVVRCACVPLILMHCVSTYPARDEDLNLRMIDVLSDRYQVPVGYSGHEVGISTTVAAVAMGACCIERHITLDRSMWGSDQAASMEPEGFRKMVRYIRTVEAAMGDGIKRVLPDEVPIQQKLIRVLA